MLRKPPAAPSFRDLSMHEMESFLAHNQIGRIAFSFRDSVDIRPIRYSYGRGWLFGRTSPSDKLVTLRHNQWVAFEVDEVSGPLDWKSVVVRGTFYRREPKGTESDMRLYRRALRAIRKLSPASLTRKDQVPFRTVLFGIAIGSMTGRACSTKAAASTD